MGKKSRITQPWDFVPANFNERANRPATAGTYYGKALKNRSAAIRESSTISPPKDKPRGFKKKITQA